MNKFANMAGVWVCVGVGVILSVQRSSSWRLAVTSLEGIPKVSHMNAGEEKQTPLSDCDSCSSSSPPYSSSSVGNLASMGPKSPLPLSPLALSKAWDLESWRKLPIQQQPNYKNPSALAEVVQEISLLPPLVHPREVLRLKQLLADAADGKLFLLQGGDCAERFQDCNEASIFSKMSILVEMSKILRRRAGFQAITVGRFAGQYAKPRSSGTEVMRDGTLLQVFKGDSVNGFEQTAASREHDPTRLLKAHYHSACTLNYIRAAAQFANLTTRRPRPSCGDPRRWKDGQRMDKLNKEEKVEKLETWHQCGERDVQGLEVQLRKGVAEAEKTGGEGEEALSTEARDNDENDDFSVGDSTDSGKERNKSTCGGDYMEFFTSHEGLLLDYESAVTKRMRCSQKQDDALGSLDRAKGAVVEERAEQMPTRGKESFFNLGAHFLWIGDRTRQADGAHVEYFRGIANPVGIKVGPDTDPNELCTILDRLNPQNEKGKVCIITRLGHDKVEAKLPTFIRAVEGRESGGGMSDNTNTATGVCGRCVLWVCDPMHGNTYRTNMGVKTRNLDHIASELTQTFAVHEQLGSCLGGLHIEFTNENVTECVGGPQKLIDSSLHEMYTTQCDPRLNRIQALFITEMVAELLANAYANTSKKCRQ